MRQLSIATLLMHIASKLESLNRDINSVYYEGEKRDLSCYFDYFDEYIENLSFYDKYTSFDGLIRDLEDIKANLKAFIKNPEEEKYFENIKVLIENDLVYIDDMLLMF